MSWFDIGVNLTNKQFEQDREAILEAAFDAEVGKLLLIGSNLEDSQKAYSLCEQYPNHLYSTAGCHPHDAKDYRAEHTEAIRALCKQSSVVAVGECGLDFNRNYSEPAKQIEVFVRQLQLAAELNMPVFLHEREAHMTLLHILKEYLHYIPGAVLHCFTGTEEELQNYLELDLYIGITGWICDERRGEHLKEAVKIIPDDRLMLETDSPFLLPRDLPNKPSSRRNEPKFLPHVAQVVADCREVSLSELKTQTTANARHLFKLS